MSLFWRKQFVVNMVVTLIQLLEKSKTSIWNRTSNWVGWPNHASHIGIRIPHIHCCQPQLSGLTLHPRELWKLRYQITKDFILHQPNPVPIRYYTQSKDNSKQHAISYTEENEWICIYVHIMQDHKTIACGYVMNFHSSMYACSIVTWISKLMSRTCHTPPCTCGKFVVVT